MKTTNLLMGLLAAAGIAVAGGAQAQAMSKDAYDSANKNATARYKTDREACNSLSGNAKDICVEEAKGKEKVAKAESEAAYKGTPKTRENARLAHAEATYNVAKEKCDDASGNAKDVCVKEAKAAYVHAKADAKVDRVAADTRNTSAEKTAEARHDAASDKRDADYKVSVEKCDSMSGTAKDACVSNAKAKYGKS